jgi:hypothetical protein
MSKPDIVFFSHMKLDHMIKRNTFASHFTFLRIHQESAQPDCGKKGFALKLSRPEEDLFNVRAAHTLSKKQQAKKSFIFSFDSIISLFSE